MRRYADAVEVRRGWVSGPAPDAGMEAPEQFLWRGRLWKVRSVLATWVETGAWWGRGADESAGPDSGGGSGTGSGGEARGGTAIGDLLTERELWRVEAGRAMPGTKDAGGDISGVFDLSFDWSDGRWHLVGCTD